MATLAQNKASNEAWLEHPELWPTVTVECPTEGCTNQGQPIVITLPGDDQLVVCGGVIGDDPGSEVTCGTVLRG